MWAKCGMGMKPMATNEIQRLLLQSAALTPPLRIVSAISEKIRTLRVPKVPHSIAEELWHIVFWQDRFLQWARREDLAYPQHAELGWRQIDSLSDSMAGTRRGVWTRSNGSRRHCRTAAVGRAIFHPKRTRLGWRLSDSTGSDYESSRA
jgi:hypothetical protein